MALANHKTPLDVDVGVDVCQNFVHKVFTTRQICLLPLSRLRTQVCHAHGSAGGSPNLHSNLRSAKVAILIKDENTSGYLSMA